MYVRVYISQLHLVLRFQIHDSIITYLPIYFGGVLSVSNSTVNKMFWCYLPTLRFLLFNYTRNVKPVSADTFNINMFYNIHTLSDKGMHNISNIRNYIDNHYGSYFQTLKYNSISSHKILTINPLKCCLGNFKNLLRIAVWAIVCSCIVSLVLFE